MNLIPKINGKVELTGGVSTVRIARREKDPALPREGYRLTVREQEIVLSAGDDAGFFYGQVTLEQLLEEGPVPCGVYEDVPRYAYRCFLLDVSRHFFPLGELKKLVEECARLKLNAFHWHLSDDQGFRIESKRFPRLNEIASWREEDGEKIGGFYTQEEIRELVAFAAERHVTVVPEIDLPGHTSAITAAYPELSCSGEPGRVETGAGIYPRILCGGEERVYEFLAALLDEVTGLFPGPWFHIGGDEAPKDEWKRCPKCQAAMGRYGLRDEEELQAYFTARLADLLEAKGKTVIGANEILASGKMKKSVVAQYWTDGGAAYSAAEIPKGRRFIFSNVSSFYLDYDPAMVTMRGAYSYEPHIPGGEAVKPQQILGLEAPLWTEYVTTCQRLEEMAFPRLAAMAENAWTKEKDWEDFCVRLRAYAKHWEEKGVAYGDLEKAIAPGAEDAAKALLEQMLRWGDIEDKDGGKKIREKLREDLGQQDFDPGWLWRLMSPAYSEGELEAILANLRRLL